jgi:hypothetical protein
VPWLCRQVRQSVIFDLDNDGDLDIVTNDFNSEPQVLVSDLAQQKQIHCLKIVLEGATSNRNGLGATVRVRTGAIPTRNTTTASQDIWRKAPYRSTSDWATPTRSSA